jgi:hypothetical protein
VSGGIFAEAMVDTIQQNVTGRSAFTVGEFCGRNRISKGLYYKLDGLGLGPRYFLVGEHGHRRITLDAERELPAQREAATAAEKQSVEEAAA